MSLLKEEFDWDKYESYIGGNQLIQNKRVRGQESNTKVFCFEPYAQELFDIITGGNRKIIRKDLEVGDVVKIVDIFPQIKNFIKVELEGGLSVEIDMSREKKFCQVFGYEEPQQFIDAISTLENKRTIIKENLEAFVTEVDPIKVSLWNGYTKKIKEEFQGQIGNPTKAYVAKIMEANKGGYFVEVQGVEAFMPGSLAAPNKIHDFRDLLGKEVIVMVEDFIKEMNSFIVSHKKYIEYVLPTKIKELSSETRYVGSVTGTSKYGIFLEFENIFTGLLHTSKMRANTAEDFRERKFKSGDQMSFYINEITKDNRIILTEESPADRRSKIDSFYEANKDKVIEATVAAVMDFGIIVNFGEVSGLVPNKEFKKKKYSAQGMVVRESILVMISEINEDKIIFKLPKEDDPK